MTTPQTEAIPPIDPSLTYPLPQAKRFFGGNNAWIEARRQGLAERIRYVGRRGFVSGADLIEFIALSGKTRDFRGEAK
jgi:hypothetical protein